MARTNRSSIDVTLDSVEYKLKLKETLVSILAKAKSATTEASVASAVETELFYFIKVFFDKDIVWDKEIGQSDLKHKRRVFTGRLDAVSNDLVIEYKRPDKLRTEKEQEKATQQVDKYLIQLKDESNVEYNAILTDGQKIRYFYYLDKVLHHTPFKNIEIDDLDKLVKSLINVGNKKFVPQNIVQDFKLEAKEPITLDLAKCLFDIASNNMTDKTDMLFQEWQELFHLSENDRGQNLDIEKRKKALSEIFGKKIVDVETDYKALFVLQTTYAIIVKLIACKVITRLSTDSQCNILYFSDLTKVDSLQLREFMENLEDGYSYTIGGIRNLLEGDFFSWYAAEEQWTDEEAKCIINIINTLEGYTDSSLAYGYTAIDIFKDLYMEIMPNEVRHSLGEYFTPSWLADYVIKNSEMMIREPKWKAIDPCCGSGIFIVTLIKHILKGKDVVSASKEEKKVILDEILERVQGIDINPLSVLTARVSYLLAIAPLLGEEPIEIPIYLGDSANIPNKVLIDDVECYKYVVNTKQGEIDITLPCGFVESKTFLEKMSILQTVVKNGEVQPVYKKFLSCIDARERNETVLEYIYRLSERLVELHKNKWDGIWLRIVTNYMLVARIKDIDIIVGNPPWVKWEFLPQVYAEKIKKLCLDRHLFSGQTYMGAISLNICALISNVTASTWLKKDGVLAFLMPKTLMTQDSYAGFRNFYTDVSNRERLYLQKVDDWSNSGNPFVYTTEKFFTYYYQRKPVDYSLGIPICFVEKKRGSDIKRINTHSAYSEVEGNFYLNEGKAYQLDEKRTGFTMIKESDSFRTELYSQIIGESAYKARSGVEFTPAEVYFIEPLRGVGNPQRYRFKNSEFLNAVYKVKNKGGIELETEYVYPVVKSPCIREFGISENDNYCIFPYEVGATECVPLEKLNENSEYLTNYLIQNKAVVEKQSKRSRMIAKGKEFYALSKVGTYTYGEYSVTFRDNTKLVAAVVSPIMTPWGEMKKPVCAKHAPYISMDKKGRYISEDEAYYLCGILNTNVVQEYFKFSFSGRSYSIDFNIKLPLYDEKDKLHKKIAELSRVAHRSYNDEKVIGNVKKEIEKIYLKICAR
ncbi:MAG: N-6 DNA methylase [Clostridiales bacterium]|nr:N-6 DNA methylase [Roseburia sp.]MDD7636076.1 N-6 DNA methylase [Clostridiales bacterium]MDY4112562.1 N-6 DNA methylase [Roseburia sp.]